MADATYSDSPWFLRMKQIVDTLEGARKECGCADCIGCGDGTPPEQRPCDHAIEIAANLMALYEIRQQKKGGSAGE